MVQKIVPHLWFDKEAKEAAEFYVSVFENSKIKSMNVLHNTPSGDCDVISFEILGYEFMAISAGPYFKINPSISFHIRCKTIEEVEDYYGKLSDNGKVLMELNEYLFSKKYAWIEDKYGVSWQIIHTEEEFSQKIVPAFLFTQDICGKAREAVGYYSKIFPDSKINSISEYGKNEFNEKEDNVMYSSFNLCNEEFIAMDSGMDHKFKFNEAVSFIINCKDQEEIDYYWNNLTHFKESEQCGWLKDKFGVSWQVVPEDMNEMMATKDEEKMKRLTESFLKMKKFDLAELKRAYEGESLE